MRILILTDSSHRTLPLKRVCSYSGLHTDVTESSNHFLHLVMCETYTAAVVFTDFNTNQLLDLYRLWRSQSCTTPFIIVTNTQSGLQRARFLELGVTEYYIQPFSYSRLLSSILLKEYQNHSKKVDCHKTNYFEIDVLRRSIAYEQKVLLISKTEFNIFSFLLRHKGIVLSRLQIWEEVWGYEEMPVTNTVDVHINRLRKKLPESARKLLTTIHGIGYRIESGA